MNGAKTTLDRLNAYKSQLRDLKNKKMDKTLDTGKISAYEAIIRILTDRLNHETNRETRND